MEDLTNLEVRALGRAVGLDIQEPELTEVAHSLNAILEMMDEITAVRSDRRWRHRLGIHQPVLL